MRSPIFRFFAIIAMVIVIGSLWRFFNLRYEGYMTAFIICCCIMMLIFFILIYSLVKFRQKKPGAIHFHSHVISEVFWVTIPFIIIIALTLPAAMKLHKDVTNVRSSYQQGVN